MRRSPAIRLSCYSHSLNTLSRKREYMKVIDENQALSRRLKEKRSCYNVAKWRKEFMRRNRILHNVCEYPYKLCKTSKLRRRLPKFSGANFAAVARTNVEQTDCMLYYSL
eukprot:TRINITY_DN7158_c0_g1_i3.p2 TRINITY_DN7158_c0_g1~~TRINITY_DN7158_c0_g1_i3.p2  ORF type:complete len:110 (-),score=15.11 TRINITY_DN7158_c0_g1_i3:458-787(-)